MTDDVFTIGELRLSLDGLLATIDPDVQSSLEPGDLALIRDHLRDVLTRGERAAPAMPGLPRRIREGEYLAVGALSRLGLSVIFGPVLHVVAAGSVASAARRLLRWDSDWRPRVLTIYARLDGLDRTVFETVHEAQNKWITTNYDAEVQRNFAAAFGRVAPTADDVVQALADLAPASDIERTLALLVYRGILDADGRRYWIRF